MRRNAARAGLLAIAWACVSPGPLAADSAVVLQYHHVADDTPEATSVTVAQFEAHLAHLAANDYAVWPLDSVLVRLRAGRPVPERCVAFTFDDAYRSVRENAWPRLRARGWSAAVFVSTEGIDEGLRGLLTWDQMRVMSADGVAFGPHGHTHGFLVRRLPGESEDEWAARVRRDIVLSRDRLREELGVVSPCFAYPYGEYDPALEAMVLDLGLIGLGQHSGCAWGGGDFGAVPRFAMSVAYAGTAEFATKVASLPLPVIEAVPADPVLSCAAGRPVLRLTLAPGNYDPERLACYVSGQGRVAIEWVDREGLVLQVAPEQDLPLGRSRYNLTAPHRSSGRYFWYSHLWIRGDTHTG